jgi:hypothetical protein
MVDSGARRALGLVAAVALAGCGILKSSDEDKPSTCYPSYPVVTPAEATAGATVTVASQGIGNCPSPHRLRSYELRLRTTPAMDRGGAPLGVVTVERRTGSFRTEVRIPAGTRPGPYYVQDGQAPTDHYHWPTSCEDNASCAGPLPNVTVIR